MSERRVIRIVTCGVTLPYVDSGGWCAIVYSEKHVLRVLKGALPVPTTRNQASFCAVQKGLASILHPSDITIQTDLHIISKVLSNEWRVSDRILLAYYNRIMRLIDDSDHRVQVVKVPGIAVSEARRNAIAMAQTVDRYPRKQPSLF